MNEGTAQQRRIANYLAALAHLLTGKSGRFEEFIEKIELVVSGSPTNLHSLVQLGPWVRTTGRTLLWIHETQANPLIPDIALATLRGNQFQCFENCMLWMGPNEDRASLVPDNNLYGSFQFGDDLTLRHDANAPDKSFGPALPAQKRAYDRLHSINAEQGRRGDKFPLPETTKVA